MRKSFSAEFMAKVAMEAIKEEKTIAELSSQYEGHRTQIAKWRKRALDGLGGIFQGKEGKSVGEKEKVIEELYRQIGQLKVENEWLKKNLHRLSVNEKRGMKSPLWLSFRVERGILRCLSTFGTRISPGVYPE